MLNVLLPQKYELHFISFQTAIYTVACLQGTMLVKGLL